MPRRRKRTTNRVRQEDRRLRVRGIRRGTPDVKKLSRAFIGLALARAEAEARAQVQGGDARERESTDGSAATTPREAGDGRA
jgi:hypothetical protein